MVYDSCYHIKSHGNKSHNDFLIPVGDHLGVLKYHRDHDVIITHHYQSVQDNKRKDGHLPKTHKEIKAINVVSSYW